MPNVIGNFLVGIGLKFDDKETKKVTSALDGVKSKILQVGAVAAGAFGVNALTNGFTDATNRIVNFSRAYGLIPNQVAALGRVAQQTGGDLNSVMGELSSIEKMRAGLLRGDAGFVGQVGRSGIDPNSIIEARDSMQAMLNIADQLQGMNTQQRLNAASALGIDQPTLLMLSQGSSAVRRQMNEYARARPLTEQMANVANDFSASMIKLQNNIGGVADKISVALLPPITAAITAVNDWYHGNKELIDSGLDIFTGVVADNLGVISGAIIAIAAASTIAGLTRAVGLLGGIMGGGAAAAGGGALRMLGPGALVAGGVMAQPYAADFEKKYPWLVNNPVTNTLNNLPGADWVAKQGERFRGWASDKFGQHSVPARASESGRKLLDQMDPEFDRLEKQYGLPTGILRGVATTESSGNPNAVSGAGAQGLMQIMPGTQRDLGLQGNDVFDPHKSAAAGARYLSQLMKQTGSVEEALAAYNWGIGNVQNKGLTNAPAETLAYPGKVRGAMEERSRERPIMVQLQLDGKEIDRRIINVNQREYDRTTQELGNSTR